MSGNDWIIAVAAFAASVLLHGLMLLNTGSLAGNEDRPRPERSTTRVSFRSVAAPQTAPQPPQTMPEKPPEPEVTEAVEAPPESEPPKPEKRAEKARQPESTPPPKSQTAPPPPTPTTAEAQKTPAAAEAVQGTVEDRALLEQAKQEYLRRLMAHIESHKHYPRAARRRGIQGDVEVAFTLHQGGTVSDLTSSGAHSVLLGAADDAIEAAQPLPAPPDSLPLPWQVSFTMRFTLK